MPAVIHLNANMPAYGIYHMPTGEFYGSLGHTALPISMRIVEYCGSPFSSFETVPNLCSRSWTEIGHGMIKYSVCITQKKLIVYELIRELCIYIILLSDR